MRIQPDSMSLVRDMSLRSAPNTTGARAPEQPHAPSARQVDAFVDHWLSEPDLHGRPNVYQLVDHLDISSQAKTALEDTMARQDMGLVEGRHGQPLTGAQLHFVYNGSVYRAAVNAADGHGTVQDLESALTARGERIQEAQSGHVFPGVETAAQTPDLSAQ